MFSYQNFCFYRCSKGSYVTKNAGSIKPTADYVNLSTVTTVIPFSLPKGQRRNKPKLVYTPYKKPPRIHFCKILNNSASQFKKSRTKKIIKQTSSISMLRLVPNSINRKILCNNSNIDVKQKIRHCLLGSISIKQQLNIQQVSHNIVTTLPEGNRHNIVKAKLTTKYLIKNLIKNCQNIPMTIVVIYLNVICRVWNVFFAWGETPFYNSGSSALSIPKILRRQKELNFWWGLKNLNNNSCLSNIVQIKSPHNTPNTRITNQFLTYKKREPYFLRLSDNNKKITRLPIKGYIEKPLSLLEGQGRTVLNIPKQKFPQWIQLLRLCPKGIDKGIDDTVNINPVKAFCLRLVKTVNYIKRSRCPKGSDVTSTRLTYSPYPLFLKIIPPLTKLDNTYLSLWQLTKKKQNQNQLYAIFKKYWLIIKFNTCSIKLKRLRRCPSSSYFKNLETGLRGPVFFKIQDKHQRSFYSYLITKKTQNFFTILLGLKNEVMSMPIKQVTNTKCFFDRQAKKLLFCLCPLGIDIKSSKTKKYVTSLPEGHRQQQSHKQQCIYGEARLKYLYLLGCELANWNSIATREKKDKIRFFKNNLTYKSFITIRGNNSELFFSHFAMSMPEGQLRFLLGSPTVKLDQNGFTISKNWPKQSADKRFYFQTYYF